MKKQVTVVVVAMGLILMAHESRQAVAKAPLVVDNDAVECPKAGYTTIQAAVSAAGPGDTIRVCAGVYAENVVIGPAKSGITLKADPGAVLDGSTLGFCDGIRLINGDDSLISDNTVTANGRHGIRLSFSSTNNQASDNTATGNGGFDLIHDASSSPNTWDNNTCGTKSGADIPPC